MALRGATPEERTWNGLLERIGNEYGVAGVMGNLKHESGVIFNRVERLCLKRLKEYGCGEYTDESYTEAVDSGKIGRKQFLNPLPNKQYGYGICQWTSPTRKSGLYDLAKSRKVSIADEQVQIDWLIKELEKSYTKVLRTLMSAKSIKEASDIFLEKFEVPADRSEAVKSKRAKSGTEYYNKFAKKEVTAMGNFDNYIKSTGTHYISNSGSDEKRGYHGGQAGDQTGNEWCLRSWYNRPWNCVLRYEGDPRVGKLLAELGCKAALNNKIGYDQWQRETYWKQLQAAGYDPSKINVSCEADCSAGVIANIKAVGYLLGIKELQTIKCTYTGNMRNDLRSHGFTCYTGSAYTTKTANLLPGDILLNDGSHTATNVTVGANKRGSYKPGSTAGTTGSGTASSGSAVRPGVYKETGTGAPSHKPLYKMVCTAYNVNIRTSPTTKAANISRYMRQANKGLVVEYCDQVVANGYTWNFVKIPCSKHPKGYIYDYVCADYFKRQ